jgi:sugar phosphate isomerase/epimerase
MSDLGMTSYAYYWACQADARWGTDGRPMGPVDLIRETARHGLDVLQLCENVAAFDPADLGQVRDVREAADVAGVRLELGCRAETAADLERSVDHAIALGAQTLRVVPWSGQARPRPGSREALISTLSSALGRKRMVRMAIENYPGLSDAELADVVIGLGDERVGVTYDTANSLGRLARPLETAAILAPLAICVHLKDYVITKEAVGYRTTGAPLGEGELDVSAVLAQVAAAGRQPPLLIELWVDPEPASSTTLSKEAEWVERSIDYARGLLSRHHDRGERPWN